MSQGQTPEVPVSVGGYRNHRWRPGLRCSSVHFSSVAQSCPTLCDPMNCSIPGLPVHHQLLEFTQTYVHWVGDAIQPSQPLSSPSPPALNLSQNQGLFQWVTLPIRWPQYWSFHFNISPTNEHLGLISFRVDLVQSKKSRAGVLPNTKKAKASSWGRISRTSKCCERGEEIISLAVTRSLLLLRAERFREWRNRNKNTKN